MHDVSQQAIVVSAAEEYTPEQLHAWAARRTVGGHREMVRSTTAFVAVDETDAVLGFATVALNSTGALEPGEVDQLFVHPVHSGRGVAGALLTQVETASRAAGLDRLVTHASWRAVPVFERFGFRAFQVETVEIDGVELTRLRMEKALAA
jgi:putative acetyltransferase